MPVPVSVTLRTTRRSASSTRSTRTEIDNVPPSGIASRALRARLKITCSSRVGSTKTAQGSSGVVIRSCTTTLRLRRSSGSIPGTTSTRSTERAAVRSRWANVRSWRVSAAPRWAARSISRRYSSGRPGRNRVLEQLGRRLDRREQVVEVVGNPAREPTDRLEPLRLAERFLQLGFALLVLPRLADVAEEAEQRSRTVVGRAQGREAQAYEAVVAVGVLQAQRALEDLIAVQRPKALERARAVARSSAWTSRRSPSGSRRSGDRMAEELRRGSRSPSAP